MKTQFIDESCLKCGKSAQDELCDTCEDEWASGKEFRAATPPDRSERKNWSNYPPGVHSYGKWDRF